MTRDHFNSLATRLEGAWCDRPEGLLKRTVGWVMLGYVALLAAVAAGVLLLSVGVVLAVHHQGVAGTLVAGAVAAAGLLLAFFILCCLWVRFEPPAGAVLEEEKHPELHRLIREIGDLAGGVRFHQVLLDPEMNASVVQNPRLGIFGWYRTYLVIGLPLMEVLSLDEFKAVIAHEIAHLTRADGKTGAWLHRTRTTWERIVHRLSAGGVWLVMGGFFNWFWPRFNSRAFVLSRFNELAADRFAAQAVSADALASGLQRLAVEGKRLERGFWEPLECRVAGKDELPDNVMELLSVFLRQPMDPAQAQQWLAEALEKPTDLIDSHPGLAVRLSHLERLPAGGAVVLPLALPGGVSAADQLLLPADIERARRRFSHEWRKEAEQARKNRLSDANSGGSEGFSARKAWERIAALSRLDGLEKVQPEVLTLLDRKPDHSGALYLRGCFLAQRGDVTACDYLERAATDPTLAGRAFETLAGVMAGCGRHEELTQLKERAEHHEQQWRAALVERNRITAGDLFLPHEIGSHELESLRCTLEAEPAVRQAWLGAKQVQHFAKWRHLVLVLELPVTQLRPMPERSRRQLEARLLEAWDCDAYVTVLTHDETTRPVLRALRRAIPDCEVFRRK